MKLPLLTVLALLMLSSIVLAVFQAMQQGSDGITPDESSSSLLGPGERSPTIASLPEVKLHEESSGRSFLRRWNFWSPKRSEHAMLRLIKNRPTDENFDTSALDLTNAAKSIGRWKVIRLPEQDELASQALAIMTSRQQAFYVVDKKSKIWFFNFQANPEGGAHFVISGRSEDVSQQIVKDTLEGTDELSDALQHFHGA